MIIFPAIDIKGGSCVRLLKGDFAKATKYKKSPLDQAIEFFDLGFDNIHIVDLDAALNESLNNENIIKEISKINKIKVQVGGGIRSLDRIKKFLDFGVDKVIIGTAAIENIYGDNSHHIIESCYKGLARSLRHALEVDKRIKNKIPSTKGKL